MRLKEGGNRPRTTDDRPRETIGNRQLSTDKGGGRPRTTDDRPRSAIGYRQ